MTDSDSSVPNPTPDENQALPLEELALTPQWVKTSGTSYVDHSGGDRESRREGRRPNRDRNFEGDRDRRPRSPRPSDAGDRRGPRPERRPAGPPQRRDGGHRPAQPSAPPVAAPVEVTFQPEEKGFGLMVEAMKQSQRAYALFDIAKLVLNKPERHVVKFSRLPAPDGSREPLFLVSPSENICLRQDEAVRFALRQHGEMIYREKKTQIDPPKGNFTFVNRCGFTGIWLGPPNYHEYQGRLVRHHQQRLRHIPFDEFKYRIQTVKDPEAVKAWLDSMSVKTEYECILDPEPKPFPTRDELEKHFVECHLAQFVTSAPEVKTSGAASRQLPNPALLEAVRLAWQQERKFPLKTANEMRGRLRHEGFHFFKDPKGITYIGRVKPQRFESITHLSEQIQKILVYLRQHFGCTRKQLIAYFAPKPEAATPAPVPAPDLVSAPPSDPVSVPPAEPISVPLSDPAQSTPVPAADPVAPATPLPVVVSEEDRVLADLHWLIQDGYVVEFSNGRLWAQADKPPPPPPPPVAPAQPVAAEAPAQTAAEIPVPSTAEPSVEPAPTPEPAQPAVQSAEPNSSAPASS